MQQSSSLIMVLEPLDLLGLSLCPETKFVMKQTGGKCPFNLRPPQAGGKIFSPEEMWSQTRRRINWPENFSVSFNEVGLRLQRPTRSLTTFVSGLRVMKRPQKQGRPRGAPLPTTTSPHDPTPCQSTRYHRNTTDVPTDTVCEAVFTHFVQRGADNGENGNRENNCTLPWLQPSPDESIYLLPRYSLTSCEIYRMHRLLFLSTLSRLKRRWTWGELRSLVHLPTRNTMLICIFIWF